MEGSTASSNHTKADQPSRPGLFEFRLNKPFTLCLVVIALLAAICVAYWRVLTYISWRLTKNHPISAFSGLIYAVAVTIHLDPLLWLVGFYDLAASFFGFAAIALFLTKRKFLSAAAFGLGVLAKESMVVPIFILLLILLEGCDLESLGGDDGLRAFYRDDGIRVFRRFEIVVDPEGKYVEKRES